VSVDVRTQLVDKISARLALITRANGYQSDIGLKVSPWRKVPMDKHSIPGIIFRDEEAQMNNSNDHQEEVPIGMWEHRLKLPVDIFFTGKVSASEARKALADVIHAIYSNGGDRWDGIAEYTDLIAHGIDVAQEGEAICGAQALFVIIYRTPTGTL
jgi:hypothetical protein